MKDRIHQPYRKELVSLHAPPFSVGFVTHLDVMRRTDSGFTSSDIRDHSRNPPWIIRYLPFGRRSYNPGIGY